MIAHNVQSASETDSVVVAPLRWMFVIKRQRPLFSMATVYIVSLTDRSRPNDWNYAMPGEPES